MHYKQPENGVENYTWPPIATSSVHNELDYCNLMYCCLPQMQLNRHQHIHNVLARVVVVAPRFAIVLILKSLHWLKAHGCIDYKVISITYKLFQSSSPRYLRDLVTIQPSRST